MQTTFFDVLGPLVLGVAGNPLLPAGHVSMDSRGVEAGGIFVAIQGASGDGYDFLADALRHKPAAVVIQRPAENLPDGTTCVSVSDARRAGALLIRRQYGEPDKLLKMLGVSGTNGKTTTAFLLEHIFNTAGIPCGLISTVAYRDGGAATPAPNTTPGPATLFPLLRRMVDNKLKAAAMELSSHALAQHRVEGIQYDAAIFTNLTGDHLDYHHDMEQYYQAKKLLYTELLGRGAPAVINIDDPSGARLAGELKRAGKDEIISFGVDGRAMWRISGISLSSSGCRFTLSSTAAMFEVAAPLCGAYNTHNLTGAILTALSLGIAPERIDAALGKPFQVPGRLEKLTAPSGADFYVDYAHTDDALRNVLATLRPLCRGHLFVVFGAGGDRDRSKRPRMGGVAAELADELIVTSDNPRSEVPEAIIADILAGIPTSAHCRTEPDRRAALALAVNCAGINDIVLVAGKGHENYQEITGVRHHFDDRETLLELFSAQS